jgi:hypothetical protein
MPAASVGQQAISGARKVWRWVPIVLIAATLVLAIYLLVMLGRARDNELVKHFVANAPQMQAMMGLTMAQIGDQAEHVSAGQLIASPYGYDGRYVVATGNVSGEESMLVAQNVSMNAFNEESNYRAYVLDDELVVVDISGEGPQLVAEGTQMKAYGKVIVARMADIFELPWVGPDLLREFGGVRGMSERVVFLVARGVQVEGVAGARAQAGVGGN